MIAISISESEMELAVREFLKMNFKQIMGSNVGAP